MNIPNSPEGVLKERLENDYEDNIIHAAELIDLAATYPDTINDDEIMQKMAATQRALKTAEKALTANHTTEKGMYLSLGRVVDRTLKDRSAQAKTAADRIGQITGSFAYRKQQEAERIRIAGIHKAQAEAREAARLAAEAEAEAETVRQIAAKSKEASEIYIGDNISEESKAELKEEAEVDRINEEAEALEANNARLEAERKQDAADLAALQPEVKAATSQGGHVRVSYVPSISDRNKIDLNILHKFISNDEILRACKAAHKAGITEIPGITFTQNTKAIV